MPETLESPKTAEVKPRYTTPEQLESYRPLMDENRKWVRANSKDKTFHRVAHMIPSFTGATGEDFVGHPDHPGNPDKLAQMCFWRVAVERYEEKVGKENKVTRETLGSFFMDADKFLKEFEAE